LVRTALLGAVLLFTLVPSTAMGAPPPAPADTAAAPPSAEERAAALKKRGDAAMDALHYDEAIDDYTQAYAASPDPALLYNRGRVHQARGEWPAALADIEKFAHDASPDLRQRVPKLDELLAEVRGHVATVTLTSNVDGARVLVRKTQVGTTPIPGPLQLDAGPAIVEVLAEGFFDWRRELELKGGATTVLVAQLGTKSTSGVLRVSAQTPGSRVRIDDAPVSGAPAEAVVLAGVHRVVVHADGYDDKETNVVVVAGESKDVTLEPEKRPPLTSKWWFWTGIGVVVAAGAVTTYALLTSKPADTGDHFQPGQVSAPLLHW
jgi:hypothetical protein